MKDLCDPAGMMKLNLGQCPDYCGVPLLGLSPDDPRIDDKTLCDQIMVLARIWYFLNANERWEIKPDVMRANYGVLLCGDERAEDLGLGAMLAEARRRASSSEVLRRFFEVADPVAAKYSRSSDDVTNFINSALFIKAALKSQLQITDAQISASDDLSRWISRAPARKPGVEAHTYG